MELASFSVRIGRRPSWVPIGESLRMGGYVYVLFVPSRSTIARVWTEGMRWQKHGVDEVFWSLGNGTHANLDEK